MHVASNFNTITIKSNKRRSKVFVIFIQMQCPCVFWLVSRHGGSPAIVMCSVVYVLLEDNGAEEHSAAALHSAHRSRANFHRTVAILKVSQHCAGHKPIVNSKILLFLTKISFILGKERTEIVLINLCIYFK